LIRSTIAAALKRMDTRGTAAADEPRAEESQQERAHRQVRWMAHLGAIRAREFDRLRPLVHLRLAGMRGMGAGAGADTITERSTTAPLSLDSHALCLRIEAIESELSDAWLCSPSMPVIQRHPQPGVSDGPAVEAETVGSPTSMEGAMGMLVNGQLDALEAELANAVRGPSAGPMDKPLWLDLLGLYRAAGRRETFDALRKSYLDRFDEDPELAWIATDDVGASVFASVRDEPVWVSPSLLDESNARALAFALNQNAPGDHFSMDWHALERVSEAARPVLQHVFEIGRRSSLRFQHIAPFRLLRLLASRCSSEVDSQPWWLLRFAFLQWIDKPVMFSSLVEPYRRHFGASPPDWSAPAGPPQVLAANPEPAQSTFSVVLAGQIYGDSAPALAKLKARLAAHGESEFRVDCSRLVSLDFVAMVYLLNIVATRPARCQQVTLVDVHRLLAALFSMVGIWRHARHGSTY